MLVAVVCAIGLGWSALISRPAGSTALTYVAVVSLTILSTGVMGLLAVLSVQDEPVRVWGLSAADTATYQNEVDQYWTENEDGDGSEAPAPPIGKCSWHQDTEHVPVVEPQWGLD